MVSNGYAEKNIFRKKRSFKYIENRLSFLNNMFSRSSYLKTFLQHHPREGLKGAREIPLWISGPMF